MFKTIISLIFIFVFFYGYINNMLELVKLDFKPPYKAEILRASGIPIFPMGTILGWIELEDIPEDK